MEINCFTTCYWSKASHSSWNNDTHSLWNNDNLSIQTKKLWLFSSANTSDIKIGKRIKRTYPYTAADFEKSAILPMCISKTCNLLSAELAEILTEKEKLQTFLMDPTHFYQCLTQLFYHILYSYTYFQAFKMQAKWKASFRSSSVQTVASQKKVIDK